MRRSVQTFVIGRMIQALTEVRRKPNMFETRQCEGSFADRIGSTDFQLTEERNHVKTTGDPIRGLCGRSFSSERRRQLVFQVINFGVVSSELLGVHAIPDHIAVIDGFSDIVGPDREFPASGFIQQSHDLQ